MTESAGRPAASVIRVEGGHVEADVCDTGKCLTENYPKKYQMAHPSKEIVTVKKKAQKCGCWPTKQRPWVGDPFVPKKMESIF